MQSAARKIEEISGILEAMGDKEREELDDILAAELPVWVPMVGPQSDALESMADIVFYGGSAGGGKTDLLLGNSLTQQTNSIIYRRQSTQLLGIQNRLLDEIIKSRKNWNGQDDILRLPDRRIEFGSCNNLGDENKYQGRPHDFIGFDEITHFLESQFRFLIGWLRTTTPGQRCRVICAGNPPTDENGRWVIQYWAPWLDDKHPNPALPGEIRWYTTIDGKDVEVESGRPFKLNGRMVQPISRTFISSRVTDNPFLMATGYEATLQALPEPLRSQMLNGDFKAGVEDSVWQVFPTAWVDAAMARWTPNGKQGEMTSAGVDVARGGSDQTVVSTRYGRWYSELKRWPGKETPNGSITAGIVVSCVKDAAPIHVDALGVGGETIGHLESNGMQVEPIVGYDTKSCVAQTDKATGRLTFRNLRAMIHWRFRESLDPETGDNIALPPDPKLKSDLCAPLWQMKPGGIQIEEKSEIKKRIGRSPDDGDAVIYCSINTPKLINKANRPQHQSTVADIFTLSSRQQQTDYNIFGGR
ncbi:MAG: terminase family protein [Patescibacteria group bacterium]|jgi:hypothetical protein